MNHNKPRILIYDIENTPTVVTTWGLYEQNAIETLEEWYIMSYAYKWYGESTTHVVALPDFKGYDKDKKNDKALCESLHKLFEEADVVIAHNGDKHDQKKSNARFIYHGILPPSPYKSIDTLKVAKKYFKFNSNSLNNLGIFFGVGKKIVHEGMPLWRSCMEGDLKAWSRMKRYNKQDVVLLEQVYMKLLPWMESHPNYNLLTGTVSSCPKCGNNRLQKRGFSYTRVGKYQQYQCIDGCGGWSKGERVDSVKLQ
jgi:hypothetical protein